MDSAYLERLLSWRRQKDDDLRRRDSWLALAGLHWLAEGRQTAGSAGSAEVRLPPSSPDRLGDFEVRRGQVFFHPAPFVRLDGLPSQGEALRADTADAPTFLRVGDLTLVVIERGLRLGLRIWDNGRLTTIGFAGRTWFAPDPAWIVEASFEPADKLATIPLPSVTGDLADEALLGTAHFLRRDLAASLQAVPSDGGRLWFLFGDATNGPTTYPSGRFLVAEPPRNGTAVLDFNRAYNPPCAFTPFATCPLPPSGNRLPFPVEAGELYQHDR
jgi:uncharacterized protein (DUF1684 family)